MSSEPLHLAGAFLFTKIGLRGFPIKAVYMIYLNNNRQRQPVYIPKRGSPSRKYYLVTFTLPEGVQAGEYEYALYPIRLGQTPEQMAKGVCIIWPEVNGPVGVEYQEHGDEPTFKQYDNE